MADDVELADLGKADEPSSRRSSAGSTSAGAGPPTSVGSQAAPVRPAAPRSKISGSGKQSAAQHALGAAHDRPPARAGSAAGVGDDAATSDPWPPSSCSSVAQTSKRVLELRIPVAERQPGEHALGERVLPAAARVGHASGRTR